MAYLFGYKEFYGRKFLVDKNVLVPRPESELMVEEVLLRIARSTKHITLLDIGTGSGCLAITVSKELESKGYDDFYCFGTDISLKALALAKKNARINKCKNIKFIKGNLLEPIIKLKKHSSLVIMANLPYLTPDQIRCSPNIQKEPRLALDGGKDGLKYYRKLFRQINKAFSLFSFPFFLLCEIDPSQKHSIVRLAKQYLPGSTVQIKKDLRGHSRLAIITT